MRRLWGLAFSGVFLIAAAWLVLNVPLEWPWAAPRCLQEEAWEGPPLVLPPAEELEKAEFCPLQPGGEWKTLPLEPARELLRALADNYQYLVPKGAS
ncbi:MAG: hypothetical protein HYY18_07955 [Planctomycetes bacterium]|nr:hypothetical protein [Planctomycetota bacterium]